MRQQEVELTVHLEDGIWTLETCTPAFLIWTGCTRADLREHYRDDLLALFPASRQVLDCLLHGMPSGGLLPGTFLLSGATLRQVRIWAGPSRNGEITLSLSDVGSSLWEDWQFPGGLCRVLADGEFTVLWHNRAFLDTIGYTERQFSQELGSKSARYIYPGDLPALARQLQLLLAHPGQSAAIELRVIRRDGSLRTLMVSCGYAGEQQDGAPVLNCVSVDITRDKHLQKKQNDLMEHQLLADKTIISALRELGSSTSLDQAAKRCLGRIGEFHQSDRTFIIQRELDSQRMTLHYEWCREGVSGAVLSQSEWEHFIGEYGDYLLSHRVRLVDDTEKIKDSDEICYRVFRRNGVHTQCVVPFSIGGQPRGFIGMDNPTRFRGELTVLETLGCFISEEITRRQLSDKLVFLSYHDALTGLQNRNRYIDYTDQLEMRPVASLGVAVADLNELGEINRVRGHAEGNRLVKRTADLLRSSLPGAEIFRLSGDEFAIYSEGQLRDEFLAGIQRIYDGIAQLDAYGISIGYVWSDLEHNVDRLTDQAKEMMMLQKQNYYRSVKTSSVSGKYQQNRIQNLLDEIANGCFKIYLQPQVDCLTEQVIGAEALVRYVDADGQVYSPDRFIPELERSYTVKYLDLYMFEAACRTLAQWYSEGRRLVTIAVNFSRMTILEPELTVTLRQIAESCGVAADHIEVEITESLGDYEGRAVAEAGAAIKQAGFSLALDDFGSHYTNMAILSVVPADKLKIDRSLVTGVQGSEVKRRILEHLFLLCQEIGIESIAEGVETRQQLDMLRSLGCNQIQGYLFGRPMPAEEFKEKYCGLVK